MWYYSSYFCPSIRDNPFLPPPPPPLHNVDKCRSTLFAKKCAFDRQNSTLLLGRGNRLLHYHFNKLSVPTRIVGFLLTNVACDEESYVWVKKEKIPVFLILYLVG